MKHIRRQYREGKRWYLDEFVSQLCEKRVRESSERGDVAHKLNTLSCRQT